MSKSFRTSLIFISVALLLLGLALIIWPTASQRIICYVAGALCAIAGVSRVIAQWKLSRDLGFQLSYLMGVLLALLGLLLVLKADAMIAIFGALVGGRQHRQAADELSHAHLRAAALESPRHQRGRSARVRNRPAV